MVVTFISRVNFMNENTLSEPKVYVYSHKPLYYTLNLWVVCSVRHVYTCIQYISLINPPSGLNKKVLIKSWSFLGRHTIIKTSCLGTKLGFIADLS